MTNKFSLNAQMVNKQTLWLFLALYILLMGIFIVLFSISVVLEDRARKVTESVRHSLQPLTMSGERNLPVNHLVEGARLIIRLNEILNNDRSVTRVQLAQSGLILHANVNVDAMFSSGSSVMLRPQVVTLRQVAGVLRSRSESWRYEININMPLDYVDARQLPMVETLAKQRAAEVMRVLVDGGVPFSMVSVSVRRTDSPEMVLVFKAIKVTDQDTGNIGEAGNE
ncbi:MAG: hypothetical protein FWF01_04560 [Alphaproteobacteria bacterium]|nr:hypothetical protein [Alphaproteobacteria bacterium]